MTIKAKSSNGRTGVLIHRGDGEYYIRIYERFASSFQDYDINHSDLTFVIEDEDAYMYTIGDRHWIGHSPETLGIVNETQVEK